MNELIVGFLALVAILIFYFIPSFTAYRRKHKQKEAISTLNLLLGWTLIGWVGALVWAVSKPKE